MMKMMEDDDDDDLIRKYSLLDIIIYDICILSLDIGNIGNWNS